MGLRENADRDKKMNNTSDSFSPINSSGISEGEQVDSKQGVQKQRRTFLILATVLLIGLIAALVVGGISGGGVKLPCH